MKMHRIRLTVTASTCKRYQVGDEIYFDGAFIDKAASDELCMVALNALFPYIYAAQRDGTVRDGEIQCPDYGADNVRFRLERLD